MKKKMGEVQEKVGGKVFIVLGVLGVLGVLISPTTLVAAPSTSRHSNAAAKDARGACVARERPLPPRTRPRPRSRSERPVPAVRRQGQS
jgi:hypothetical protein